MFSKSKKRIQSVDPVVRLSEIPDEQLGEVAGGTTTEGWYAQCQTCGWSHRGKTYLEICGFMDRHLREVGTYHYIVADFRGDHD